MSQLSRRAAMKTALAVGVGSGMAGACTAASVRPARSELDLSDPVVRARVRAKISGSAAREDVHGLSVLHLYAFTGEGNTQPLMTMYNYTVTRWMPQTDGTYKTKHYESGVYTKFNTNEVMDYWDNPLTGERRKVWPFIGGPISTQVGPDGTVTGPEATVKPQSLGIHVLGDQVFIPSQSAFSFPNPFQPEQYPVESSGRMFFWDSFFTISARLEDVLNPELDNVPSSGQFQNLVSWHPWLGMGQRPGRTFGRAFGTKLRGGFADLEPWLQDAVEKYTPGIRDVENWTDVRNDFAEYAESLEES